LWLRHTLQRHPVAVCEDRILSQLKQLNEHVLYMFGDTNNFFVMQR
jgi:hypothetical protein